MKGVVNIRGNEYVTIAFRVAQFRQKHPDWTIKTKVLENTENRVLAKAKIFNDMGRLISDGYAEEFRAASAINKTSAVENATTSAIGRALAFMGMGGTDYGIASAEEVESAIDLQDHLVTEAYEKAIELLASNDAPGFHEHVHSLPQDMTDKVFNAAPKGEVTKFKGRWRDAVKAFENVTASVVDALKNHIEAGDVLGIKETVNELTVYEKRIVWDRLDDTDRIAISMLIEEDVNA